MKKQQEQSENIATKKSQKSNKGITENPQQILDLGCDTHTREWNDIPKEEKEANNKKPYGRCTACKQLHPMSNLISRGKRNNNTEFRCKRCKRNNSIKDKYGITIQDYEKMHDKQEGRCAICNTHEDDIGRTLHIDHCHTTGNVRQLLCGNCNTGLGMFKDNKQNLNKAIQYLEKHNEKATD